MDNTLSHVFVCLYRSFVLRRMEATRRNTAPIAASPTSPRINNNIFAFPVRWPKVPAFFIHQFASCNPHLSAKVIDFLISLSDDRLFLLGHFLGGHALLINDVVHEAGEGILRAVNYIEICFGWTICAFNHIHLLAIIRFPISQACVFHSSVIKEKESIFISSLLISIAECQVTLTCARMSCATFNGQGHAVSMAHS